MRRRSFASEGRFGEAEPEGRASVRAGGSGGRVTTKYTKRFNRVDRVERVEVVKAQ